MNTHEYQAREILAGHGLPFAPGRVAETPEEAETIAHEVGGRVVVKAQVQVGGRGKAGGVKLAASPDEAREHARTMLGSSLKGHTVRKVLVVQAVAVAREFYLGVVLDRAQKGVTLMASAVGGVDIEEVARSSPDAIVKVTADPLMGLADYQARDLSFAVGLAGDGARGFAEIARSLFRAFLDCDCSLLEVNPLALTEEGHLMALDSKMVVDDSALYRQPALAALRDTSEEDPAEVEARELGLSYVKLDGDIGCMVNGAGLAMATMDSIKLRGGEPANFLDVGGGADGEQIQGGFGIILNDKKVRAVLVNIFGGITRCDAVAQALVDRLNEGGVDVPRGRAPGRHQRCRGTADTGSDKRETHRNHVRGRGVGRGSRPAAGSRDAVSILIDTTSKVLVQNITGREGRFHTGQMLAYGTKVVAGTAPGMGGQGVEGVPVFDSIRQAVAATGADTSIIFVPAPFAPDAIVEAADNGIGLIVCITEHIPALDMVKVYAHVRV